jgi:DNA-binding MarR family transcriptional regulator
MAYTRGVTRVTKKELAGEVWELLADYMFSRRDWHMTALHELGLTPGHMKAMFELDPDVPVPMGELADTLVCDASSATWLVDRLEERDLVERRPHPRDRRVKTVVLTPKGVEMKARLIRRLLEPPADLQALDPADLKALRDALRRLPPHPPFWASVPERQAADAHADATATTAQR